MMLTCVKSRSGYFKAELQYSLETVLMKAKAHDFTITIVNRIDRLMPEQSRSVSELFVMDSQQ